MPQDYCVQLFMPPLNVISEAEIASNGPLLAATSTEGI